MSLRCRFYKKLIGKLKIKGVQVLLFSVRFAIRITMIHVLAVGAGVREALEALGALEGLFAAVQPLVFSQMMLVLERSWTLHTFVGPLP
ncbi:hypothetical protein ALC56_11868 [Trachymyrmex septentrionalis]|uniref:Uncharacterized protein n=1 Tax=Trachymyrmex septentrionalis TaxID=34720 RepID=A0A195F0W0_9HYME|nr:hypothetical protein ALC56_11868 [Trachymyrmex septentrionalis]